MAKGVLPHGRNNSARVYSAIISLILFIIAAFRYSFSSTVYYSSLWISILFVVELLRRILLTVEEFKYNFKSRYSENFWNLLNKASFEIRSLVIAMAAFALTYQLNDNNKIDLWHLAIVATTVGLISPQFHFGKCSLATSLAIADLMGMDYGSGMAHSYFYGYLKITLCPEDGLVNLMKDYESKHNITFHKHKLYILMPLSFHCPYSLDTRNSTIIENAPNLDSIHKNRAGVQNRTYKNSVYKINYQVENRPCKTYVVAEYASPLKTIEDVINSNAFSAAYYNSHREDILYHFYSSLKRLIQEDPEINGLCEIIYYNDKDKDGQLLDVGYVLRKYLIKSSKTNGFTTNIN